MNIKRSEIYSALERDRICANLSAFTDSRAVTFLNPFTFLKLLETNTSLKHFDKICIDGIALKYFLEFVYRGLEIERMSFDFTSVANTVFNIAAADSQHGYILGSDDKSNASFRNIICSMFPGIALDGRCGYFDNADDMSQFLRELADSNYDFVIIGMGAVRQENAARELVENGFRGRIYTCGGFIHQTAMGGGQYYPGWVNRLNLRFAYRMFREPTTVRRYLLDYPKAFFHLTRNMAYYKY